MRKLSLKLCACFAFGLGLTFSQVAFAQETKAKVQGDDAKIKADGAKAKTGKDEHDHSKGGAVTNAVGTGAKETGKAVGKGVKKAGKGVGKAAKAVTEPVH
jgi:hypothetical protein